MNDKFKKVVETKNEAIDILKEKGKCLIVRPTGFGKSYILAHIAPLYDHVVYFYPRDIIRLEAKEKYKKLLKNVDIKFITYSMLVSLYKNDIIENSVYFNDIVDSKKCLFIFDEAHLAGGQKTSMALDKILSLYPNCHLLGATATPERSDYFNVRYHFFDGIEVSTYGLIKAINDGIFPKPYYVYSLFEIDKNFEKMISRVNNSDLSKDRKGELIDSIKSSEMKYMNLYNEVNVIRDNIALAKHNTNYMKFISFFSDIKTMYSKIDNIAANFANIFPDHKIRTTVVASDTKENRDNVNNLHKLTKTRKTIDLIFCVDMLSYGYHVKNLNGIIMYRNTYSDIVYKQQIGRCISIDSDIEPIIFDFVGNYLKHDYIQFSIINQRPKSNKLEIEIFGKDQVKLIDNLKDIDEIDRLIDDGIRAELEDAIIDAYFNKNAPIKYCLHELKLSSEREFLDLIDKRKE